MAEKTPGRARKSTSTKKETTQKGAQNSQKSSTVTPIDQAGINQSQSQSSPQSGSSDRSSLRGSSQSGLSPNSKPGGSSPSSSQSSSQSGAHPTADQSGAGKAPNPIARQSGASPSVLNPSGSVQAGHDGGRAAKARPSGQELQERIRARAYELFEQRGRHEGFDQEDWARAEAEVLAEFEREKSA